jgi:hypothetical protein
MIMASTSFFRYLFRFTFIKAVIRFLLSAFSGLCVLSCRVRQWSAPVVERWLRCRVSGVTFCPIVWSAF